MKQLDSASTPRERPMDMDDDNQSWTLARLAYLQNSPTIQGVRRRLSVIGGRQSIMSRQKSHAVGTSQHTDLESSRSIHKKVALTHMSSTSGSSELASPRSAEKLRKTTPAFTAKKARKVAVFDAPLSKSRGRTFTRVELRQLDFFIGHAQVLHSLNADLHQGELVGMMGESGSGKTTLLNVMGGRATYGRMVGDLLVNNTNFDPHESRHLLGYVPQSHILFKELTVYENLAFAAKLRLPRRTPVHERESLIEMALDLLGLQECRHFVCDPAIGERLSGGQMRRIGIGLELVCNPPIMLLDEPTSALDAVNTRLVVAALKDLTRRGVLVVASLHQPRHAVYEMLDRLLILRKGELIYGGHRKEAVPYFQHLGFKLPPQAK